jgi:tetratricopeptide (TPR) repeat protein
MKKIKQKGKSPEGKVEDHTEIIKNPKIEVLLKISDLKNVANSSLLEGDYDDAIKYSEKIIRLAIKHNMDNQIEEQQAFMKAIAEKVQQEFFLSEINDTASKIEKIYKILTESDNFAHAHEILELFLNNYKDKIDIDQIPLIKSLIERDKKEWIKHH